MTVLGPRASHLPPEPGISRPNLLSSVGEPRATDGRWQAGIQYRPLRYNTGGSVDPCGDVGEGVKTLGDDVETVQWDPYAIWTEDFCSTLGNDGSDVEARARADLDRQSSHKIEEIFWTNTVDGADFGGSHPNISLSDPSIPTSNAATNPGAGFIWTPNAWDSFPPVRAFSDMIDALTDALGGVRGMIHVERRLLPYIAFYGLAVQNGQRLVTTLHDHIVVPGTGYDGSDPSGNASSENYSWIYGTSMVEVLISPIDVFGNPAALVDRTNNDYEYRAERMALAHWDHQAHIGIPVCLEDPAGDCSDIGS